MKVEVYDCWNHEYLGKVDADLDIKLNEKIEYGTIKQMDHKLKSGKYSITLWVKNRPQPKTKHPIW